MRYSSANDKASSREISDEGIRRSVCGRQISRKKMSIVKAEGGSVFDAKPIVDALKPCPVNGGKAHRAWLASGVNGSAFKRVMLLFLAGITYGHDLAMRCMIVQCDYVIAAFSQDFSFAYDDSTERAPFPARMLARARAIARCMNC